MDQVTVLEVSTNVVEVAVAGPQGPTGPQGIQGPQGTTAWSDLTGKPTTVAASGLTDAESTTHKGVANGYAGLDSGGKVPAAQLPSYVDDVLEYANLAVFPGAGSTGIIYVADDTGKIYRWSGSAYVEISPSPGSTDSVAEGSVNLYFTAARVLATVLSGLSTVTNAVITASDTVLSALGKLQKQITDLTATVSGKQPLDTDLTAIAALASSADKLPYATGAGAWSLADFTAFGRSLIDDANSSTARTTLGLTAAATMAIAAGSWTPALQFGGVSTGITYTTQSGTYVRIGQLVWVECNITLSSKGSASGLAQITGLPFAKSADGPSALQAVGYSNMISMSAFWGQILASASTILPLIFGATNTTQITDANFSNTSTIRFSGIYNMGSMT